MNTMKKISFGILGGTRGMDMYNRVLKNHPYAQVSAICETYPPLAEKMTRELTGGSHAIRVFSDYNAFLDSGIDAVVIANYANEHATFAIQALKHGIHVYSEVMPAETMSEAVALCEAVEESGKLYAYGENYCYLPAVLEMRRMFEQGLLGNLMHTEGTFINDCSFAWHMATRGQRDHWRNYVPSTFYCSHSMGPMMFASGRRATKVIGMEALRMPHMAKVGARSGSAAMVMMELDNGAMAKSCNGNFRRDFAAEYRFIGEHGTVENDPYHLSRLHWFAANADNLYDHHVFYPQNPGQDTLGNEFFHATGRTTQDLVENDPFAFSDIYGINVFIQSILGNELAMRHLNDVYRAIDMSIPGLLAYRSILDGSNPILVPDFRQQSARDLWRHDNKSTNPNKSEGEDLLPSCKSGTPFVEDTVYDTVSKRFLDRPVVIGSHYLAKKEDDSAHPTTGNANTDDKS